MKITLCIKVRYYACFMHLYALLMHKVCIGAINVTLYIIYPYPYTLNIENHIIFSLREPNFTSFVSLYKTQNYGFNFAFSHLPVRKTPHLIYLSIYY